MAAEHRRLLIFPDLASIESLDRVVRAALESTFRLAVSDEPPGRRGLDEGAAIEVVGRLAEGVGLVDARGEVLWMNQRLAASSPELLRAFADACVLGLRELRGLEGDPDAPGSIRHPISGEGSQYEVIVAALPRDGGRERAIGLMLDVTASHRLQQRVETADAAGGELLEVDAGLISQAVTARLGRLEERIARGIRAILDEDSFEVRLLDPKSNQLELVMTRGIDPLPIGQRLHARAEGQGISGLVAATGQGYVCRDASSDPHYLAGLSGARSSVTVPIRRGEAVIGTLNVESTAPQRFDEEDRLCLELYARYVGLAMTILDMLVVERWTTNREVSGHVLAELRHPLESLRALQLRVDGATSPLPPAEFAAALREAIASMEASLQASTSGPRSILGAEEFLRESVLDRSLAGRRVLVADDEPQIRQTVRAVLERRGCEVTVCTDGASAIAAIEASAAPGGHPFALVISDVRMPDRNGYEVFRAAKKASSDLPVILMTGFGYDPHHSIVRSSQEGLHCFLFKPFQVGQLLEEVHKALVGQARPA